MIQVDSLTKYFGPVMAVDGVTFNVEAGEIVGLLGNNGAGKTTIMRMLTTYMPATSGVAKVAGFDVMLESMEVRQRIGYLPESIPLYSEMRVEEYLNYRARLKGVDRKSRPARVTSVLERCRVREVSRRLLGTLSKGYRQRVGLADALIAHPQLLILDEPTDGLDPEQKAETLAMLRELAGKQTVLLSSHMLTEVESIVNRVIILRRGHLALAKKLSELETDDVIVMEVRGPLDKVTAVLRGTEGVESVVSQPLGDGMWAYQVRAAEAADLREKLFATIVANGWSLRRLDVRRRSLQDRWNEINSYEDVRPQPAPDTAVPTPGAVTSTENSTNVTR
jgi:ABC-2 type transport system ATP-binding protein